MLILLMFGIILQLSHVLSPGLVFVKRVLITGSFSLLAISLFRFPISSFGLAKLYVSSNFSFSSRLSKLLAYRIVHCSFIILYNSMVSAATCPLLLFWRNLYLFFNSE